MSLAISGSDIFAGTRGGGVWKRPLSEMVGIEEFNNPLSQFQIYPNPVTNQLSIRASSFNLF